MISLSRGLPVLLLRMDLGGRLVVMEDGENMFLVLVVDLDRLEVAVIGAGIQMVGEGEEVEEEEEVVETTGKTDEFLLQDLPEQADVAEEEAGGTVAAAGVVPDRVLGVLLDDVVQLMTELVCVSLCIIMTLLSRQCTGYKKSVHIQCAWINLKPICRLHY